LPNSGVSAFRATLITALTPALKSTVFLPKGIDGFRSRSQRHIIERPSAAGLPSAPEKPARSAGRQLLAPSRHVVGDVNLLAAVRSPIVISPWKVLPAGPW